MPGPGSSEYTYRVAVIDADGNHGYEIGCWPPAANINDPTTFEVVERIADQQQAAARTVALNCAASAPKQDEPEPELPYRSPRRR